MDKASRKALTREYKEMQHPMGVFRVLNTVDNRSFVGTSKDLRATLNGQLARLRSNWHINKALQSDWNRLGEEAFRLEVLDTLTPPEDKPDYDPTDDLKVLQELWIDKLDTYNTK